MLKPRFWRRCTPQGLSLRIFQIPVNWLMVRINGLIVRTIDLCSMAIRVQNIQEERIGDTMATRSALNIGDITSSRHQIQQIDNVERCWHPESNMVQAWAMTVGKGDIMHTTFAVHPCGP